MVARYTGLLDVKCETRAEKYPGKYLHGIAHDNYVAAEQK